MQGVTVDLVLADTVGAGRVFSVTRYKALLRNEIVVQSHLRTAGMCIIKWPEIHDHDFFSCFFFKPIVAQNPPNSRRLTQDQLCVALRATLDNPLCWVVHTQLSA